jgi:Xaa-Pro aminopeptidase
MKADLDRLMQESELDALLVAGPVSHNPNKTYFTGLVHVTWGYLLKRRDQAPVLFHYAMERDEAARSGLETKDMTDYKPVELLEQAGGDQIEAGVLLLEKIVEEYGVRGRVALYGKSELGPSFGVFQRLEGRLNGVEFIGEPEGRSVLTRARATKDEQEIAHIREMGKITIGVVGLVTEFLSSHRAVNGKLENSKGEILTIGEVKKRINLWLAMRGAENLEGSIFALGADAGVPHSTGQDDQPLETGQTIIFDIFPSQAGGGYYYDFTRTWCLGFATEEAEALYQDVLQVYDSVFQELKLNTPCRDYQIMTCERFESRGHPTILNTPGTTEGYVHGLGHGLGLAVHEGPSFSHVESNLDVILPDTVFTFEPGLYYPERGMGVRLEDTVWARADGRFEILAEFPKDLVLEIPGA